MTTTAETAAQCDKCGCTTIAPELLISVLRPFRWPRQSRRVCPRCLARAERRAVAVISGLFLATAVPVAVAWRCGRFEPDPMADHLMTFAWMCTVVTILNPLLIAAHELAHALVGCCVGLRVFRISLGSGVCLIRRRLAGVALEVHGLPWGGFCNLAPQKPPVRRWRLMAMIAAGPLVHVSLLAYVALGGWPLAGGSWWADPTALMVFSTNLVFAAFSFWPHDTAIDGTPTPNDGKHLLRLLRGQYDPAVWVAARWAWELHACQETGRAAEARLCLERLRDSAGATPGFRLAELAVLAGEGHWATIRSLADGWLAATDQPVQRMPYATWTAVACVYGQGDLARAEELSLQAVAVTPWDPAVQIARAVVLLATGRDADAEAALRAADRHPPGWIARAAAAHAWAELHRRRSDSRQARQWQARAAALDPRGVFKVPSDDTFATR